MVFVMWTRVSDINGLSIGICNNLPKNQNVPQSNMLLSFNQKVVIRYVSLDVALSDMKLHQFPNKHKYPIWLNSY